MSTATQAAGYYCQDANLSPEECAALQSLTEGDVEALLRHAATAGGVAGCVAVGVPAPLAGICGSVAAKIFDYISDFLSSDCPIPRRMLAKYDRSDFSGLWGALRPGEIYFKLFLPSYKPSGARYSAPPMTMFMASPMIHGPTPDCGGTWPSFRASPKEAMYLANKRYVAIGPVRTTLTLIAAKDWNGELYIFNESDQALTRDNGETYTGQLAIKAPWSPIAAPSGSRWLKQEYAPIVRVHEPYYPPGSIAVYDAQIDKFRIIIPV